VFDYDAELYRYHAHLLAAVEASPTDHVLDVGCGAGLTTRDVARTAASVVGVDVSAPMLAQASQRSERDGLRNISFVQADAQTHPFPAGQFDLAVSRFGTMFFADPVAAFTNIGRALRPGGRLVQLVWQSGDRQEWSVAIHDAFGAKPPLDAKAFSLAVPDTIKSVAGLREPVYYGPDAASALDAALALRMTQDLMAAPGSDGGLDRLRTVLAAHQTSDGVAFDSRAWLVIARRE
jgi:ubiquinone/menaquinone biosynthesis C-methylase UbiE